MSARFGAGRARSLRVASVVLGILALAACGGDQPEAAPPTVSPATSLPSPTATTTTTTAAPTRTSPRATTRATTRTTTRTTATTTTREPTPTSVRTTVRPAPTPTPRSRTTTTKAPAPTPSAATCKVPSGISAQQVVLVDSSGSSATVRACRRSGGRYLLDLGPYNGHVGRNGVSWSKREGDLRTPAGTYPLRGGFGARGNPGLAMGWFRVDASDVWVDDSGSSLYNSHQRKPVNGRWDSAENLLNTQAYNYAQVVGYNEALTPGKGSAIFLHVDTGGGTAGCVSLPTDALLTVLRWERAGAVMSIR
jgi:L,D-peptidoglycan transpeptidase YkuD (ErfK/YbiS/YcfS/YnhG family)